MKVQGLPPFNELSQRATISKGGSIGQTRCRCIVIGEVVSEAELKFALLDR